MSVILHKLKNEDLILKLIHYQIKISTSRVKLLCNLTNSSFTNDIALEALKGQATSFSYGQIINILDFGDTAFEGAVAIILEHALDTEVCAATSSIAALNAMSTVLATQNDILKTFQQPKIKPFNRIVTFPELYSPEKHVSLSYYFRTVFQRWARTQGLDQPASIHYLSLAFESEPKKNHIDRIIGNWNENTTATQLLNDIIDKLVLKNESAHDLQLRFLTEKPTSNDLVLNFSKLVALRTAAYDDSSDEIRVQAVKNQFERTLNLQNNLHLVVYNALHNELKNEDNEYKIMATLRDIEFKFKVSKPHQNPINPNNISVSSNEHSAPQKFNSDMEVSNLHNLQRNDNIKTFSQHENNSTSNSRKNNSMNRNLKAVKSKLCTKCKTRFNPKHPAHAMCFSCFSNGNQNKVNKMMNLQAEDTRSEDSATKDSDRSLVNAVSSVLGASGVSESEKAKTSLRLPKVSIVFFSSLGSTKPIQALWDRGAIPSIIHKRLYNKLRAAGLCSQVTHTDKYITQGDGSQFCILGSTVVNFLLSDSHEVHSHKMTHTFLVADSEDFGYPALIGVDVQSKLNHVLDIPSSATILINPSNRRSKKAVDRHIISKNSNKLNNLNLDPIQHNIFLQFQSYCLNPEKLQDLELNEVLMEGVNLFETPDTASCILNLSDLNGSILMDNHTADTQFPSQQINSDYKIIDTRLGPIKVGASCSNSLISKIKSWSSSYKGNLFCQKTLGCTKIEADIHITNSSEFHKVRCRYIPLAPSLHLTAKSMIERLVNLGILKPSTKAANAALLLVPKPNGSWRLVSDMVRVNKNLENLVIHIPNVTELVNKISQARIFCVFDQRDGYFNIPFSQESLKACPIITTYPGLGSNFQYMRLTQGLSVATSIFTNTMSQIYKSCADYVDLYLDDTVVSSKASDLNLEDDIWEKFLKYIEVSEKANLRLNLSKCVLFTEEIDFLGYAISKGRISITKKHINSIQAIKLEDNSKSRKHVSSFLNYFGKYAPLANHLKQIREANIGLARKALERAKNLLLHKSSLVTVNFKDMLSLYTDASESHISAVLVQHHNGIPEPVQWYSKPLDKAFLSRSIYEKELFALVHAVAAFKFFLFGNHAKTFFVDNKAVSAASRSRSPSIRCFFQDLKGLGGSVSVRHLPSNKNIADIFSRTSINAMTRSMAKSTTPKPIETSDMHTAEPNNINNSSSIPEASLINKVNKFHYQNGCLKSDRLFRILSKVSSQVTKKLCVKVVEACEGCSKRPKVVSSSITPTPSSTNQLIYIDHKAIPAGSQFSKHSRFTVILSIFEPLSGAYFPIPVEDYTSFSVCNALRIFFILRGTPSHIIADNFRAFQGELEKFGSLFNIQIHHTSIYKPQGNLAERPHEELNKILRSPFPSDISWVDAVAKFSLVYNCIPNSTTTLSPFSVLQNSTAWDERQSKRLFFSPENISKISQSIANDKLARIAFKNRISKKAKNLLTDTRQDYFDEYTKGQFIVVKLPGLDIRKAIVLADSDKFSTAVLSKFYDQAQKSSFYVSKSHIRR